MNEIVKNICDLIGNKAFFMMGAYNKVYSNTKNSVSWKIKGSPTYKFIEIVYDLGADLYNLMFIQFHEHKITAQKEINGVYWDQVHEIIEHETKLYLSITN